jgi:hypothetical protein
MPRRRRGEAKGGVLAGAMLSRAVGLDEAVVAVRRAVARVELDGAVIRLGIAAIGEAALAQGIAAALAGERDVLAGTLDSFLGSDHPVVAVAPASVPAPAVIEEAQVLGDRLLGVVLVFGELEERAELEARAKEAEARVAELEQQVERLTARVRALEGELPVESALVGDVTIGEIEALVRDAERRRAPEADEWAAYLMILRDEARLDGTLPARLGALVHSVFGKALAARSEEA